jgi:type III restriction enzyme
MFREPEYQIPKSEALKSIFAKQKPSNSFDQLFIVEHPAFRTFYEWIEKSGGHVSKGDSSKVSGTGDFMHIEVTEKLLKYDIAWPEEILTKFSDDYLKFESINLSSVERWPSSLEEMKKRSKVYLSESHISHGYKARTWAFATDIFDYNQFLRSVTSDIIGDKTVTNLSGNASQIMELIDNYCSNYLFGSQINYDEDDNFMVLNILEVYEFVKSAIRKVVWNFAMSIKDETEKSANWKKLSEQKFWKMRSYGSIPTTKCIYERLPFTYGGGLERAFATEILEKSPEVLSYSKINQFTGSKHMYIKYLSEDGHYKSYYPDFLVKTKESVFVIETKSDKDFKIDPDVVNKARNAKKLCGLFSGINVPFNDIQQPMKWEYLIIPETSLKDNIGLSFDAIVEISRNFLDLLLSGKS